MNSAEWLIKQAAQLPDQALESVIAALLAEALDRALPARDSRVPDDGGAP